MGFLRRTTTSQGSQANAARRSAQGITRATSLLGRVLLWGCVLLLLIRGIASVLGGVPQTAKTPGPAVTATQPAVTTPPTAHQR